MKRLGKHRFWKLLFYIALVIYLINAGSILFRGSILLIQTSPAYNYWSLALSGFFLISFYRFLKKGALTKRYLLIMFLGLVLLPLLLFLLFGSA